MSKRRTCSACDQPIQPGENSKGGLCAACTAHVYGSVSRPRREHRPPGCVTTRSEVHDAVRRAMRLCEDRGDIYWGIGCSDSYAVQKLARTLYTWLTGISPDPGLADDQSGVFPMPDPPFSIEAAAPVMPGPLAHLVSRAMEGRGGHKLAEFSRAIQEAAELDSAEPERETTRTRRSDRHRRGESSGKTHAAGRDADRPTSLTDVMAAAAQALFAKRPKPPEPTSATIGSWQVQELLAEGQESLVHVALDLRMRRQVAIKFTAVDAPAWRHARHAAAARALAETSHSGVMKIFSKGKHGEQSYLVLEYLRGEPLSTMLADARNVSGRSFTAVELLSIFRQLADALAAMHAHKSRVVHANIRASKVMILPPLRAVLMGFGHARVGLPTRADVIDRGPSSRGWMSPEQLAGDPVDARTDIFLLGLLMYELATGVCLSFNPNRPEWADGPDWHPKPPRAIRKLLPHGLSDAILDCLEVDPDRRCKDGRALAKLLASSELEELLPSGRLSSGRPVVAPGPPVAASEPVAPTHVVKPAKPRARPFEAPPLKPVASLFSPEPWRTALPLPSDVVRRLANHRFERVHQGDRGMEYLVRKGSSDELVALRMLDVPPEPTQRDRTIARIEKIAQVDHPNLLAPRGVLRAEGLTFLVTPHLEATTLSHILAERGILPMDEALVILEDLLTGLESCHQRGVFHLALRPEHVKIGPDGHARLGGFNVDIWIEKTLDGIPDDYFHTPSYMTPEEVAGDQQDARSDLYGCGLLLYEMLTAKRATTGQTLSQMWEVILKKVPTSVKFFNAACPPSLITLTRNLLEKRMSDRYQSVPEVRKAILAVRQGREVLRTKGQRT